MQVTLYRCGLCNNHDFDRPFKVERHMDEQHSNFGYMCTECRKVFLRRDSKHKNCAIGEQGGKSLKFVSRNNYQFGEEEKEQYNKFKKESRELVITIENTCTSNNIQTIVTSEVTVNEKKEKDKTKKEKKTIRRIRTVLEQKGKENTHQRDLQVDQLHLYQSPD